MAYTSKCVMGLLTANELFINEDNELDCPQQSVALVDDTRGRLAGFN